MVLVSLFVYTNLFTIIISFTGFISLRYCNREFDDEKVLISHQKAKHFKCLTCSKKLFSGPGLKIHCMQVHRETIEKIPNSLAHRHNIDIEIFGSGGIPEKDKIEHEKSKSARPNNSNDDNDNLPSTAPPVAPPAIPPPPPATFPGFPAFPPGLPPTGLIPGALPPPPSIPSQLPPLPTTPFQGALPPPGGPPFMGALPPPPSAQSHFPPPGSSIPKPPFSNLSGDGISTSDETDKAVPLKEVPKIVQPGPNSRIVYPEEDISLEELRARLPRYKHFNFDLTGKRSLPPPPPPTLQPPAVTNPGVPSVLPPGLPPPPHFMPGMAPPPRLFRPPLPFGGAGLPPGIPPPPHLVMQGVPPPMFGQMPPGFPPRPGGLPPPPPSQHFMRPPMPPPNPNLPPHLQPHFRL